MQGITKLLVVSQIAQGAPLPSIPASCQLCKECLGLSPFALALPQATQTDGRTEFQGFGLLVPGNSQSLLEAGFHVLYGGLCTVLCQEQFAFEPVQMRIPPWFMVVFCRSECRV